MAAIPSWEDVACPFSALVGMAGALGTASGSSEATT